MSSAINDVMRATQDRDAAYEKSQRLLSTYSAVQSGELKGVSPTQLQVEMLKTSNQAQSAKLQKTLAERMMAENLNDQKKTINLFA